MNILETVKIIILGIIEGITEWLPVSSTGHILLFNYFFPVELSYDFMQAFNVIIQLGAILAVPVFFGKKILPLSKSKQDNAKTLTLWLKIIVACIPAGIIGILFDDILDEYLHTPFVIACTLIIYGILFIVVENNTSNKELKITSVHGISYKNALFIGLFQVLSLIPGTSRSGVTLLGALLLGITRTAGAEFTFFLAIPVMFGASLVKLIKFGFVFSTSEITALILGCSIAFAVSLFCINFLMKFVKRHTLKSFGIYRIILGLLIILAIIIPSL